MSDPLHNHAAARWAREDLLRHCRELYWVPARRVAGDRDGVWPFEIAYIPHGYEGDFPGKEHRRPGENYALRLAHGTHGTTLTSERVTHLYYAPDLSARWRVWRHSPGVWAAVEIGQDRLPMFFKTWADALAEVARWEGEQ